MLAEGSRGASRGIAQPTVSIHGNKKPRGIRRAAVSALASSYLDLAEFAFHCASGLAVAVAVTARARLRTVRRARGAAVDGLADLLHASRQLVHRLLDALRVLALERLAHLGNR